MKGQDNKMKTGNLPGKEFRLMIVKMVQNFWKTMDKMQNNVYQRPRENKEQTNRDE